ncbi:MAG: methionyl-tRNA formyltransferase [bacterium]
MRIVFMGSSEASATALRAILKSPLLKVVGVVTQPDRPSGRRQHFTPCPCKAYATLRGLQPVISPEKVNAPEVLAQLAQLKPDVIVVVAFGQFLGRSLLAIPLHGCVNSHFSLLPKYRGAAPVQAAIAAGEEVAGVTIMVMSEGVDTGDVLLKAIEPICSDDTAGTLMERLAILGAVTLVKALKLMIAGGLAREPQEHSQATYAPKMQKHDGLIDWSLPAAVIERRIRAYDPWPGAFTFLPLRLVKPSVSGRLKVLQAEILKEGAESLEGWAPGSVCALLSIGPVVTTGDYPLCLMAVQPDGSRRMDGRAFLNGHAMRQGDRFGEMAEMPVMPGQEKKR